MLARDLSDMPTAKPDAGWPPLDAPLYSDVLGRFLEAERLRDGARPTADGTRLRHSDAGKCARALSLGLAGAKAEPMDLVGLTVMDMGTMIHERYGHALEWALRDHDCTVELETKCRVQGVDASGHADAVVRWRSECDCPMTGEDPDMHHDNCAAHGTTDVVELKTVGGYAYKLAIGVVRANDAAQGPRDSYLLQTAVNALALDADRIAVVMLAREAVSKSYAARHGITEQLRVAAEWHVERDEWEPLARREVARWRRVLELADERTLAPRAIVEPGVPPEARVADPTTGRWEVTDGAGRVTATGETWQCGYCPFQAACNATGTPHAVGFEHVPPAHRDPERWAA